MSGDDRSWTIAPTILWFSALHDRRDLGVLDGGPRRSRTGSWRSAHPWPHRPPDRSQRTARHRRAGRAEKPAVPLVAPGPDRGKDLLEDTCLDGTNDACKRWAMDGFYRALDAARRQARARAARVVVRRLGRRERREPGAVAREAAGRGRRWRSGLRVRGRAAPLQRPRGDHARSHSGDWSTHAISSRSPTGFYGVGGSTTETSDGKATIKLVAGTASKLDLYYLAQPKGGTGIVAQPMAPRSCARRYEGRCEGARLRERRSSRTPQKIEITTDEPGAHVRHHDLENLIAAPSSTTSTWSA